MKSTQVSCLVCWNKIELVKSLNLLYDKPSTSTYRLYFPRFLKPLYSCGIEGNGNSIHAKRKDDRTLWIEFMKKEYPLMLSIKHFYPPFMATLLDDEHNETIRVCYGIEKADDKFQSGIIIHKHIRFGFARFRFNLPLPFTMTRV